jgi:hypothetical protein
MAADCSRPVLSCAASRAVGARVVAAARTGVGMSVGKERVKQECQAIPCGLSDGDVRRSRLRHRSRGRQPLAIDHCFVCCFCLGGTREDKTNRSSGRVVAMTSF